MKYLIFILILLIPITSFSGKLYRCKNAAGEIEFKDKPCQGSQKTEKQYSYSRGPKESQCKTDCFVQYRTCVANAGVQNTAEVDACFDKKNFCRFSCDNPVQAQQIIQQRNSWYEKKKRESRLNEQERRLDEYERRLTKQEKKLKKYKRQLATPQYNYNTGKWCNTINGIRQCW